jgi:hypothetical protein
LSRHDDLHRSAIGRAAEVGFADDDTLRGIVRVVDVGDGEARILRRRREVKDGAELQARLVDDLSELTITNT